MTYLLSPNGHLRPEPQSKQAREWYVAPDPDRALLIAKENQRLLKSLVKNAATTRLLPPPKKQLSRPNNAVLKMEADILAENKRIEKRIEDARFGRGSYSIEMKKPRPFQAVVSTIRSSFQCESNPNVSRIAKLNTAFDKAFTTATCRPGMPMQDIMEMEAKIIADNERISASIRDSMQLLRSKFSKANGSRSKFSTAVSASSLRSFHTGPGAINPNTLNVTKSTNFKAKTNVSTESVKSSASSPYIFEKVAENLAKSLGGKSIGGEHRSLKNTELQMLKNQASAGSIQSLSFSNLAVKSNASIQRSAGIGNASHSPYDSPCRKISKVRGSKPVLATQKLNREIQNEPAPCSSALKTKSRVSMLPKSVSFKLDPGDQVDF